MTLECADCGKPGFKDAGGVAQHERRATAGSAPEGKERRGQKKEPALEEKPPKREHLLHRKVF